MSVFHELLKMLQLFLFSCRFVATRVAVEMVTFLALDVTVTTLMMDRMRRMWERILMIPKRTETAGGVLQ